MLQTAKARLAGFLHRNVTDPVLAMQLELSYQNVFDIQCRNRGLTNEFYPLGAAACYGLMYLLFRVLEELPVSSIVEFGSGQSTVLIDRIKRPETCHAWVMGVTNRLPSESPLDVHKFAALGDSPVRF